MSVPVAPLPAASPSALVWAIREQFDGWCVRLTVSGAEGAGVSLTPAAARALAHELRDYADACEGRQW